MERKNTRASELVNLRELARELLTVEVPELNLLEQMASLAAAIASEHREVRRRELIDRVQAAQARLSIAIEPSQLARLSVDKLSALEASLDRAVAAHAALSRADSEMMLARDRGDYAAIAPLALEADTQNKTLAAAREEGQWLVQGFCFRSIISIALLTLCLWVCVQR
jgi:hypothetical protein